MHVELDAGFDAEGEKAVALRQFQEVGLAGLSGKDQHAIWADVWGQFLYAENHNGGFPANQSAFVAAFSWPDRSRGAPSLRSNTLGRA